jgi:WhiB family transcriptional regulator, redox-sensing transcriptional regulator
MSDWRHRAACRDEDPELFFPIGNTGPALLQIEDAKAVCRRCDVIDQCLQWALESGQDAGVWGGMSEDERRALKRRAARSRTYGPAVRAEAVEMYRQVRPECRSDQDACRAVAERLGVDRLKTVRAWAVEAGLITLTPGVAADAEKRRSVLLRLREVRRVHKSDYAAHVAVAAEFGLHPETVRQWARAASTAAHVAEAGAA